MPMTRHRARSSFTFEIKSSNRRTSETVTRDRNTSAAVSSLADQVFGKSPIRPLGLDTTSEAPAFIPCLNDPIAATDLNDPVATTAERPLVRRVLPDLLTILVDPVEERAKREAEEKSRRRASRTAEVKATRQSEARPEPVPPSVPVSVAAQEEHAIHRPTDSVATPPVPSQMVEEAALSGNRKGQSLKTSAMRAERTGRPLPRLPAGQRWKRRLPK